MYLVFILLLIILYIPLSVIAGLTKPYMGGSSKHKRKRRRRKF